MHAYLTVIQEMHFTHDDGDSVYHTMPTKPTATGLTNALGRLIVLWALVSFRRLF